MGWNSERTDVFLAPYTTLHHGNSSELLSSPHRDAAQHVALRREAIHEIRLKHVPQRVSACFLLVALWPFTFSIPRWARFSSSKFSLATMTGRPGPALGGSEIGQCYL